MTEGNVKTYYVVAKSKRAARRAANADWRWESGRTWLSDEAMAHVLAEMPGRHPKDKVYSFEVRADIDTVKFVPDTRPSHLRRNP